MKDLVFTGRICLSVAVAILILAGAAYAGPIAIFNTGVNGSGTPLANGTIGDSHYTLISVPSGGTAIQVLTSAGGFPIPPWLADDAVSAWIGPNNNEDDFGPAGSFTYRTTFTLSGFNPATASLVGKWATDDFGTNILLNGVSTGNASGGFSSWSAFTINSGFVAGVNTLDFVVSNGIADGPTGLRVEVTGTADPTGVPEPASFLLLGAGLAAFGIFRRRLGISASGLMPRRRIIR
jgi:hypothetical protein